MEGSVTLYVPDPIYQLDGSPCQGSNCWAAVGSWQMDGQSEGEQVPTPTRLRAMAGVDDCSGGNLYDIQTAFQRTERPYAVRSFTGAELRAILTSEDRRLFAIPTDYKVWPDDKKCDSPDFDGYHMIGVIPGILRYSQLRVMNPLCSVPGASREARYQKVKLDDIMAAARAVAKATGQPAGTIRVGIVWRPKAIPPVPEPPTTEEMLRARNRELEDALRSIAHITDGVLRP